MARCFYCLGEHETSQCVSRATDRVISSQKATAKATAEVIEKLGYRTLEQLRDVGYDLLGGLEGIREAIEGLNDFLSWAHSEIIWRMEKQIELLTGIHDMLKNPRATQADELYKMGVDSFRMHRLADTLKLLQEARELNPGDYRVLITLGHTYAQMDDSSKALEYFQDAVDYARDNSYKANALLLSARAFRCLGRMDEAIEAAKQASNTLPSYSPAHYELASCIAERLGRSTTTR